VSAYPLEPIPLTVISTLTIGVPAFFLALGPNSRRYLPGFLRRVLRFSVPVGLITGAAAYVGFAATRWVDPAAGVAGARTTATVVVLVVALWTLGILARPLHTWKVALIATMGVIAAAVVALPVGERVVLLQVTPEVLLIAGVLGAAGALLVELSARLFRASPAPPRTRPPRTR
jgi:cation-transporting ATPase E